MKDDARDNGIVDNVGIDIARPAAVRKKTRANTTIKQGQKRSRTPMTPGKWCHWRSIDNDNMSNHMTGCSDVDIPARLVCQWCFNWRERLLGYWLAYSWVNFSSHVHVHVDGAKSVWRLTADTSSMATSRNTTICVGWMTTVRGAGYRGVEYRLKILSHTTTNHMVAVNGSNN